MNISKILAPLAAAAALVVSMSAANAAPIFELKISDGINPDLIITDNGAGDSSGTAGSIVWFGSFGSYNLNIASGTSIGDPLSMHLGAIVQVIGASPTGTLTFTLTQTDLSLGTPGSLLFESSGGGAGPGKVNWGTYVDASNVAFGTGTQLTSCNTYACATTNSMQTLAGAYSSSIQATFDYTGVAVGKSGSLDITVQGIPEPTSIALAGLALCGLGLARRRKA